MCSNQLGSDVGITLTLSGGQVEDFKVSKIVYTEHNYIFIGLYRSSYLDVFLCLSLLVAFMDCRQEFSEEFVDPVICFNAGL